MANDQERAEQTLRFAAALVQEFFDDEQAALQHEQARAVGQLPVGRPRPSPRNLLARLHHLLREWTPRDQAPKAVSGAPSLGVPPPGAADQERATQARRTQHPWVSGGTAPETCR